MVIVGISEADIELRIREKNFTDKWAAFDWMYKNQLGRRNLTAEQRIYLIGKLYEARKYSHGGECGNQYTKLPSDQSGHMIQSRNTGSGKSPMKISQRA